MNDAIKEYSEAFEAHMEARKVEIDSRILVKKTHYRLLQAKDVLRNREYDILSDMERQ